MSSKNNLHIVLYEPEIAPNTGNIMRLASNVGAQIHLIEPLGFAPDEKKLRRAGLDYNDWDAINLHRDFESFLTSEKPLRLFSLSTKHQRRYTEARFISGDYLLFGPETRGLPKDIRAQTTDDRQITLPMTPNNRSLNLANAVAVVAYEAWRQMNFDGAA